MKRTAFAGIHAVFSWAIKLGLWVALAALLTACVMPDGTVVTSWPPILPTSTVAAKTSSQPASAEPSPAEPLIEQGKQAGSQKDLATAMADFNQAIAIDPKNAEAYYYRAITHFQQGDNQAALADIDQSLRLEPNNTSATDLRAQVRGRLGDYQGMYDDYTQELALLSADQSLTDAQKQVRRATLYNARHFAADALKEPEAALADLESYLAIDPWDTKAFMDVYQRRQALAVYIGQLAQYEKSAANAAHSSSPEAQGAYDQGMRALLAAALLNDTDEAITATAAFSATLAADPTFADAYHKRALAELFAANTQRDGVTSMQMNGESGVVERIDAATGTPYTQTMEAYRAESNAAALRASQAAAIAAADLQQALKLDPTSTSFVKAEAANDLAVLYTLFGIIDSTPITDAMGVAGSLFDVRSPDAAHQRGQDAALPLFDQAVKLKPEWILARRNRAMRKLLEALYLVNSDDAKDAPKALAPAEVAKADADYIISHTLSNTSAFIDTSAAPNDGAFNNDNEDGWPYYIRVLATAIIDKLNGVEPDETQANADAEQFILRTPNVNRDDRLNQAASQLRVSLSRPSPKATLDGRLALSGTEMILVNDTLGFTLTIPPQAPNHLLASVAITGVHYIVLHDDFRNIDILVLDTKLGDAKLKEDAADNEAMKQWLTANFLPLYPDAQIQTQPLATKYGAATLVDFGDQHFAFLPFGGRIYSVAYQIGYAASFADGYGVTTSPPNAVLQEIIERLTFNQPGASK